MDEGRRANPNESRSEMVGKPDEPKHAGAGRRARIAGGCLIGLLIVAAPCVFVYRVANPSDWVDVDVEPFPRGHDDFCLIAEDARGVEALPWYRSKVLPFEEPPFLGGTFYGGSYDHDGDGFIQASVQWREAKRYGVLVRLRDDRWRLWWLGPDDVQRPSLLRFIVGGGRAVVHLPAEDRAETPTPEFLKRLGLEIP